MEHEEIYGVLTPPEKLRHAADGGDTYPRDLGTSPSPKSPRGGQIPPPESTEGYRWESHGSHRQLERGEKEKQRGVAWEQRSPELLECSWPQTGTGLGVGKRGPACDTHVSSPRPWPAAQTHPAPRKKTLLPPKKTRIALHQNISQKP